MTAARVRAEDSAYIRGIGQSAVGRRLGRDELDLTLEAALLAIADAGLTPADIDGLASYPGSMAQPAGFSGPGTPTVQDALRLELGWHSAGPEGAAQLAAVTNAVLAVHAGLARNVLVYRTVTEGSAQGSGGRAGIGSGMPGRMGGFLQWSLPFGAYSAANWLAMYAQRHFHEFGTTRDQLGQIAVNARRNATLNPAAVYREPLTLRDYLDARVISTPFVLYDCDVPCDGATAVIVSSTDTLADAPHDPIRIEGMGTALRGRPSWDQWDDLTTFACRDAAAQMWSRTDLTPADVDMAQLYDGFSFLTMAWIEALGFCGRGESGPFVEGGTRISRDGELPLNTGGGQLSGGRLHGFGHLYEACVQFLGRGGDRQLDRPLRTAAVAAGGGPIAGCLLLRKD